MSGTGLSLNVFSRRRQPCLTPAGRLPLVWHLGLQQMLKALLVDRKGLVRERCWLLTKNINGTLRRRFFCGASTPRFFRR